MQSGRRRSCTKRKATCSRSASAEPPGQSCVGIDPRAHLDTSCTGARGAFSDVPSQWGLAGEGLGRTARAYVGEESDRGIVPMNSSNKEQKIAGGEGGGKAAAQGEHPPAQHAPDSVRDTRVPGVCGCAAIRPLLHPSEEPYALTSARTDSVRGVPGNRHPYRDSERYVRRSRVAGGQRPQWMRPTLTRFTSRLDCGRAR